MYLAEIVEGHVRCHVLGEEVKPDSPKAQAADELIDLIKSYLRYSPAKEPLMASESLKGESYGNVQQYRPKRFI